MAARPEIVGAVLVGGESRRMGADKACLELAGESLAARACGVLARRLDEVVVVSRSVGDHGAVGFAEIADLLPGFGPLAGIHAALEYANGRAVLALACDLPRVSSELVQYLLERAEEADLEGTVALVPDLGGRVQPLCAVYSGPCAPGIGSFLRSGGRRVMEYVETIDLVRVELGPELPFFRSDLFDNVNDPAAARRLGIELSTVGA